MNRFGVVFLGILLAGCAAPHKPVTAFTTAIEYRNKGDMTEYRRALERELQTNPANLDARYDLALDLEQSGHENDARKLYEENLQRRWHFPSAINLANLLNRAGQPDKAEQILRETVKNFPHEATPWYLLAGISVARHQQNMAADQYRQAITADPNNAFARLHFAVFLASRHDTEAAVEQGDKAVKLQPQCAPCWQIYGNILQQSGKNREAVSAYQRSLALNPDSESRLKLIQSLQSVGERVRAQHMQDALKALQSDPVP